MSISKDNLKNNSLKQGELSQRIKEKIREGSNGFGETKVSFTFGISPILDECLKDLLRGQPELSPQTMRWLNKWFGTDYK
jgi:hypothetical protein